MSISFSSVVQPKQSYISSVGNLDYLNKLNTRISLPNRPTLHRTEFKVLKSIKKDLDYVNSRTYDVSFLGDVKPSKPWKPAKVGTVQKFSGILGRIPELKISNENLQEAMDEIGYE